MEPLVGDGAANFNTRRAKYRRSPWYQGHHTMKHILRMIAGCMLPFLLIFFLPSLGISDGATLMIAIVLMFACHLFMMPSHHTGAPHEHHHSQKGASNE